MVASGEGWINEGTWLLRGERGCCLCLTNGRMRHLSRHLNDADAMATIYLSSTYEDLKDHRRVLYEYLHKAGHHVIAMEDYVATDQRPVDKCLKDVEASDIYVGLFAFRYGYVPPSEHNNPNGLSITEVEYRRGESINKPCLIFLVNDATRWPPVFIDAYTMEDKGQRVKALREHLLTEKYVGLYSEPHELSALVLAALSKHLNEHKQPRSGKAKGSGGATVTTWDIEKNDSPYPGLMHFTGKYAPVFFGRDMEVREVLDRMRTPEGRFLLISGASGSGKSSLVDAGVLPKIGKSGIVGDKTYTCVRMVPSKGHHPFDALLRPLHQPAERAGMDAYQLVEQLAREPGNLSLRLREIVANGLDTDGLVLFLDQMEELFTVRDLARSYAFLSALYQAVQDVSLYVIATIRSDFLQYCHEHADLLEVLKGQGHYPLGPIDSISLGEMIAKPAHCAGLTIAESLVRRLAREAGEERGSLPLLAFALRQLFDNRDGKALTETAFDQLGGLAGAIRSHVTAVEDQIVKLLGTSGKDDEVFPKLFASLVVVSIDGTPTRRWASKQKFDVRLRSVIDIFIKERLFTADEGKDHESLISVAHEKLFDGWPRLTAWIKANREQLFTLSQVEIAASEWERHGYDLNYLWPEERLKKLQGILKELGHDQVNPAIRLYAEPLDMLIERLQEASLSHTDRFRIGQYLAVLGDRRPGVSLQPDGLPDIAWIDIPGGQVRLEKGYHTYDVSPFRIAKYPVTNEQFQAFLNAEDGHSNKQWWMNIRQIKEAGEPSWEESNFPREMVSWYEAVAFCRWLGHRTNSSIRLPTEWEWQQAATGGDPQREYPWKGGWDGSQCNSSESRLNRTTAVGMYPRGATKQGVLDMAGNVWEWCQNTLYRDTTIARGGTRVVRGGSWHYGKKYLRVSDGHWNDVGDWLKDVGFRLAQDIEP